MLNRKIDLALFLVYFSLGAFYIILFRINLYENSLEPFIKTIPIWILFVFACWRHLKHRGGLLLSLGVVFGSAGDYVLSSPYINNYFLIGLGLFFIGHIFYIVAFGMVFKYKVSRWIPVVLVLIATCGLLYVLYPRLSGDLKIPVLAYMFIIFLMNATAAFRRFTYPAVFFGAVLFMVSDSLIALSKFAHMEIWDPAVMITYYIAQFLIVFGSISDAEIDEVVA